MEVCPLGEPFTKVEVLSVVEVSPLSEPSNDPIEGEACMYMYW